MSDFVQFPQAVYDAAGNVFSTFAPARADFAIENARALMWFAQLAYEVDTTGQNAAAANAKIAQIASGWGFQSVHPFAARLQELGTTYNTTGLVGVRADAVLLSFAGTDPAVWETVATDAHFLVDPASDTHRGFHAAANAADVLQAVQQAVTARSAARPLFICGHSLGAAIGLVTARRLADTAAPRAFYGYGTPRAGGATFQREYNDRLGDVTYRLVHGQDIVARVPMAFLGYRHVGHVMLCPGGAKFANAPLSPDRPDVPDADAAYVAQMAQAGGTNVVAALGSVLGGGVAGVGGESVRRFIVALLQPIGHGPLGHLFRFLPPPFRDHLQDRYIAALAP